MFRNKLKFILVLKNSHFNFKLFQQKNSIYCFLRKKNNIDFILTNSWEFSIAF